MKKYILLFVIMALGLWTKAQTSACTYTKTQSGNTVTFNYPPMITIYVLDSALWSFGDGNTLFQMTGTFTANVIHTYTAPGTYNACLTMWYHQIGSTVTITCTACQTVTIGGSVPCSASFTKVISGAICSFTSTSSGPGPISSDLWVFGDGSPNATIPNPVHTYPGPGTYLACHTVGGGTSAGTFTCTHCDSVIIAGPPPIPCVATANFSFTTTGLSAAFLNTSTCTACSTQVSSWNFGDGSPISNITNPTHTFPSAGTYTVCLTYVGTDSSGNNCSDTLCKSVTLSLPSQLNDYKATSLTIFPNPTRDQIEFVLPTGTAVKKAYISDISRRKVMEFETASWNQSVRLDLPGLQGGNYFLHVELANGERYFARFCKTE